MSEPTFVCKCRVCPRCGEERERDEHPFDGLAYCASEAHGLIDGDQRVGYEWWAHIGPFMDGICPLSAEEVAWWAEHDEAVYRGEVSGHAIPRAKEDGQ